MYTDKSYCNLIVVSIGCDVFVERMESGEVFFGERVYR